MEKSLASWSTRHWALWPQLDERQRRLFVVAEAAAGYGGMAAVSRVTGVAASTIGTGVAGTGSARPHDACGSRLRRRPPIVVRTNSGSRCF